MKQKNVRIKAYFFSTYYVEEKTNTIYWSQTHLLFLIDDAEYIILLKNMMLSRWSWPFESKMWPMHHLIHLDIYVNFLHKWVIYLRPKLGFVTCWDVFVKTSASLSDTMGAAVAMWLQNGPSHHPEKGRGDGCVWCRIIGGSSFLFANENYHCMRIRLGTTKCYAAEFYMPSYLHWRCSLKWGHLLRNILWKRLSVMWCRWRTLLIHQINNFLSFQSYNKSQILTG